MKTRPYKWNYSGNTTTVYYTFTYWETLAQVNAVSAKVTEVLSTILTQGMNDFQKEKAIHDWIEANLAYDTTLVQHSAYAGLFGNKKTVCQGYALLAYKMLKEAGIENKIIEGLAGTTLHAWNLVKLDGNWYHLDTTWDDPVPDVAGRIIYDHFNLTDDQIKAVHSWTKSYPSAVTSFDTTLTNKITSDSSNATFYQDLQDLMGLKYMLAENTVSNSTELATKIQSAISTHLPSFKVRHTNKSTAFNDLKAAVTGFSNISSYGYGLSDYLRTLSTTDGIFTVSLAYSDPIAATGVTLNTSSSDLKLAGTLTLTSSIQPVNASIKTVTWTSSNTAVATVSATGVVTGKGAGTATITATTADGGFTATSTINVIIPVTGITLNKTALSLKIGDSDFALTATVAPTTASVKTVTWSSGNPSVATVDSTGLVHAVSSGSATITAKSADGTKSVNSIITVPYPVTGVTLNKTELTANIGTTSPLTASIVPVNALVKTVTWSSSDTTIATVSATGVITPKAVGTATITVTTTDGAKTASATVNVVQPVTAVTLNKTTLSLKVGDPDFTLIATAAPVSATDKSLTWTTSNAAVATVDASGVVHAVASGTATITAKSVSGAKSATTTLTVPFAVSSVALNKPTLLVNIGTPASLIATITPTNATVKTVTWSSSDQTIATVSATGVVTGKAVGTATIKATTTDGAKTAESAITVVQPVTTITLNKTTLSLKVGDPDFTLAATIGPANATDKTLTWTSSKPLVATVDQDGVVHALAPGSTTITAKSASGITTATSIVTVPTPVSTVTLSKTTLTLKVLATSPLVATLSPSTATVKTVTWSSSNNIVATVSTTGVITAKAAGNATITVTTTDGAKTATVAVTVTN
ncbi:Ig-like domain-containing protein [Paenibacillus frigoriresistens]|uniref:Ig-like domain-containing protein n=1 Tax=Paenibacillus alginolyticus TaxID=59839 RepID=UPI001565EA23|nr:Ig-like domain-containing protein [Paenibacillus frigoriresistens]NRF90101.1 Ig-like domain-containing protein [Paenibacillus frigoriresistens]